MPVEPTEKSPRDRVKDAELHAAARSFVVKRYKDGKIGRDAIGRDYGLVLDVLLFDAIIEDDGGGELNKIKLLYKDGIKQHRIVTPRPWKMTDTAAGPLIEKMHEKGIPFSLTVTANGTNVRIGATKSQHARTFTVAAKQTLYSVLVVEMAAYLLAVENAAGPN